MEESLEQKLDREYGGIFKSEGERRIASFLNQCGVRYMYEAPVVVTQHGKQRIWYPDFHLPELGMYVEYYGVVGSSDYDQGVRKKAEVYAASGLCVIPVYPDDLAKRWPDYLSNAIYETARKRVELIEEHIQAPEKTYGLVHPREWNGTCANSRHGSTPSSARRSY
jgi:hypothetical protein